jgi:superfamily II DNA/RNA helicase
VRRLDAATNRTSRIPIEVAPQNPSLSRSCCLGRPDCRAAWLPRICTEETHLSSSTSQARTESGFHRFRLDASLARALCDAGFDTPRPIQVETIPACLEGRDVMGLAQTGTGKTAAFALPILQRLIEEPGDGPLVLVLAPTRELALQIDAEIRMLARWTAIKTVTVFGGVSARVQIKGLRRRPQIVVGCPGRVLDLLQQRRLDLSQVETLILDEADHMFDMGFLPDIRRILAALPHDRQNLLFSATMPNAIRLLADSILRRPHVVELAHTTPLERIEHFLCPTSRDGKRALLDRLLAEDDCESAIVFTRTKHRAKRLAVQLARRGLRAVGLQGNMSQPQRDRAMSGFRDGRYDILVATDIAARGLDIAGVSYVINFDPPSTSETYTHRIGRTGRSDASGIACTLVTREDAEWVRATERMLGARIPERRYNGHGREDVAPEELRARPATANGRSRPRPSTKPTNGSTRSGRPASSRPRRRKRSRSAPTRR